MGVGIYYINKAYMNMLFAVKKELSRAYAKDCQNCNFAKNRIF